MNDLFDYVVREMVRYTILTFRILFWLGRFVVVQVSRLLNNRQQHLPKAEDDLFERHHRAQEQQYRGQ